MMTKDYRTMCTSTGFQDFIFPLIHPSFDLSFAEYSIHHAAGLRCGALTWLVLLLLSLVRHTHIHTHTHSAHTNTLNTLAQRLDRSPPVKQRNSETDGIITSLLPLQGERQRSSVF